MTAALGLLRASWLAALSYRARTLVSLAGLLVPVVPLFFVADALQPVMADAIRQEGGQYFGFLLVGTIAFSFVPVAVQSFPASVGSGIASGSLEGLLATPAGLPAIVVGTTGYALLWHAAGALLMLAAGAALGAAIVWRELPAATLVLALVVLAHLPLGLIGAALLLRVRTMGPLMPGILLVSSLLGGVYYPTHVIPSWLERVSAFVPLTYGLRPLRRLVLDGASLSDVAGDLATLLLFAVVLLGAGSLALAAALRHARRAGTLGLY